MSEIVRLGGKRGQVNALNLAIGRHDRDATAPTVEHLAACPVGHDDARLHSEWHRWAAGIVSLDLADLQRPAPPGSFDDPGREVARRHRIAQTILSDPDSTEADRDVARRHLRDEPEAGS